VTEGRVEIELMAGDLAGARAALARSAVDPVTRATYLATYNDLYWALPAADQDVVLRLPVSAFDDDRATWATVRAEIYAMRGDAAHTRIYADSARLGYLEQMKATPNDAQIHVLLGLTLAYLGRKAEAIAEGQRGVALRPTTVDAVIGAYYLHQLVRIYIITGEPEKALDGIEELFRLRYYISPGSLRIDPGFAPLRNNPRFQKLVSAAS
jgi:tetratricopeptide (TPR) repeat protein